SDGPARRLGEPALLPLWRRAKNDPKRHLGRLPFVRVVQNHRGHEQVGVTATVSWGMDSGDGRWPDGVCCAALSGGRVVMSWRSSSCLLSGSRARVGATALAALLAFVLGVAVMMPTSLSAQSADGTSAQNVSGASAQNAVSLMRFPPRP